MKLIINNKTLKPALKRVAAIVPKSAVVPALENIVFSAFGNTLTMMCTDLEVTLIMHIETGDICEKEIVALIPFAWLQSVVNIHGDEPLTFLFEGKKLKITGENDVFEQEGLSDFSEYPELPQIPKDNMVKIKSDFISMLSAALLTCSKDDLRPSMTKVFLEIVEDKITMTSTNAHCLFNYAFPVEGKASTDALISAKIIKALHGFDETSIFWNEKFIAFESVNLKVIATRPEDRYPDYKVVIPKYDSNLAIHRNHLINALNKIMLVNQDQCKLSLHPETASITITAENIDYGRTASVEIAMAKKYTGEVDSISLSPTTLEKLLLQVSFEELDFAIQDAAKAVLLRSETELSYLGLIMPLLNS